MEYLVWCINVTSKQLSFPRDSNIRSKNPIPTSNDSQCLHLHKKKIVPTGNLACISFMFRSSWFHLKRRGSVREPGTEALSRSRSSFVSNLPPRHMSSNPSGPLQESFSREVHERKKANLWENPTLISWGSFLASQSKGYDPSHHPINDANSLCLSVLWDSTTSDFIIFLDQYYQSYSCTPPSPM